RDLADTAATEEVGRLLAPGRRAALDADLDDAFVRPCRLDHGAALGDAQRQRLLDADVLAGLAGVGGHQGVAGVGSADDDGVEVATVEELAVVAELLRVGTNLLGGEVDVGLIDVAHGDDVGILVLQKGVEDLVAAVAQADESQADALARSPNAAG